ncbi:MAG: Co/Zn/Cd cation transporter [Gammaproteobacteria bacterium]|jgi:cation diffusion facilitator family transporter|nr:Co/Zn/Cd cation transporter [Gammaproteobacteria bacterium]
MEKQERYRIVRRVTIVSVLTNTGLGILKTLLGYIGHSHALFADGLHSFSDLLSDILVLFASKVGGQDADHNHPYGHQRIETAATVVVAVLVMLTGVWILIDAAEKFIHGASLLRPDQYVLWAAIFSIMANEALFRYTLWEGNRLNSNLLRANAWHSRSDALSSVVVVLGVSGALLGVLWLDSVAAIIVGVLVMKMGWDLGFSSVRELIDTGLDKTTLRAIESVICAVPGVCALHCLRTRLMGGEGYVDVHILVEPHLTVSEGHYISQHVHHQLVKTFDQITDVTVHVDPEEDGKAELSQDLPPRCELLPQLQRCWQALPGANTIANITLHYLEGQVWVDLFFKDPLLCAGAAAGLKQRYQAVVSEFSFVIIAGLWIEKD